MKKLYPVIHVQGGLQALNNAKVAREAGADGVFLINHWMESIPYTKLLYIQEELNDYFAGKFPIGVNCLDLDPVDTLYAFNNTLTVPMLWADNAGIVEGNTAQTVAQEMKDAIVDTGWKGQYFGGVAFKYQREVTDLESVTKTAMQYVDIVTTSGSATGVAAPIEKLETMKRILGDKSLAIASGITVENVLDYTDFVDIFLVSTGISKDFLTLDPAKVRELSDKIHAGL